MKIIAKNKQSRFDFDISATLIVGLVLKGSEVKSIKAGSVSLKGAYIRFVDGRPVLTGAHISHYKPAGDNQHELERDRPLLLHKTEIEQLVAAQQNGQHIVPLAIGLQRNIIKLEIGVGASRKKHDKRQLIKKRDSDLEIQRRIAR